MAYNPKTRAANKEAFIKAGVFDKVKEAGFWGSARDFSAERRNALINNLKADVIEKPPPPRRSRKKAPPAPQPPQRPAAPNGNLMVFWRDITKGKRRGSKPRIAGQLKELRHQKQIWRRSSQTEILKDIFGEKGNPNRKGFINHNEGKIGETEAVIYRSEREKKALLEEFRGWEIIYHGKATRRKDLLIAMGAVAAGSYNPSESKASVIMFIDAVKEINPPAGEWLQDIFNKYRENGV